MSATMWRMNGPWRRMALALVLGVLLFHSGVMCDDDATDAPAADPTDSPTDAGATDAADQLASGATPVPGGADPADDTAATVPADTAATAAPGDVSFNVGVQIDQLTTPPNTDSQGGAGTSGTSGTSAAPGVLEALDNKGTNAPAANPIVPETQAPRRLVVPAVTCVDEGAITEDSAIKATVTTSDCEETKNIIQTNPAAWCLLENCNLNVFQKGNELRMTSPDAQANTLAEVLQSENLKGPLGVSDIKTPASSGSSVFVAVLLTGLLLAAGLIGGYFLKTRRGTDAKGIRLAEETYPVDEENQGNTLVSVAPLNAPPETQEKPSVNGEAPEEVKTEPPPSNGHSAAKTADTEL
ncbi:uncharacterized protein cd34 [Polymixia lowei]